MVADWSFEGLELSRSRLVDKIAKLFSLLVIATLHGCDRTLSKHQVKEFPADENDILVPARWRRSIVFGTCSEIKSDPEYPSFRVPRSES
jgi:hypothetical protein